MEKIIKCAICGAVFKTNKPRRKYCSFSCKEAGAKLQRMKWEDKNPNYVKEYMRKYRKKGQDSKK